MYVALVDAYGPQQWWPAETPLEVIVGAYLTQNTSWQAVEKSIKNLRNSDVLHIEGLRTISQAELQALIKPSGFMQRKAASIKSFIHFLDRHHNGSLAQLSSQETGETRAQLLALPGVGPETADAILLYALGKLVMVADEYLRRLVTRHNLVHEKVRYPEIQQMALDAFAQDTIASRVQHYNEFHAVVVELGKRHCRRQPDCEGCPLSKSVFQPPRLASITVKQARKAVTRK
jgi:endonuclease-3 related protein